MTTYIKRLWIGMASVRDYIVKKAYQNHEDLTIFCGDQSMTVPFEKLRSGILNPKVYRSKQNYNQKYQLIDYIWKPDVSGQMSLI